MLKEPAMIGKNLFLNWKLIGKFFLVLIFASPNFSCSSLSNKSKSVQNINNVSFEEKPEILDISASVFWDGEQTLGGNWISHPDVDSPERVLIKNKANGKSIVGAIFQQTKKLSNGSAKISSDAAKSLNINTNEQTKVKIIAVREAKSTASSRKVDQPTPAKQNTRDRKLSKPFIQVGIFGIQSNATNTRDRMLQLNQPVNLFEFQIKGKPYWRVVAGPANTSDSRDKMLKAVRSAGFTDAYFVSN